MNITKASAADLHRKARDFTSDGSAYLDSLTDEPIERAARLDPDAQPSTPRMLRQGQVDRANRAVSDRLGTRLVEAELELDLPVWEIVDQNGRTVLIRAADVQKVSSARDTTAKVLKLEAVQTPSSARAERQRT